MDNREPELERVDPGKWRRLSMPFGSPRSLRLDLACVALLFSGIVIGGFGLIGAIGAPTLGAWLPVVLGGPALATWLLAASGRRFRLVLWSAILAILGGILIPDNVQFALLPLIATILVARSRSEFRD